MSKNSTPHLPCRIYREVFDAENLNPNLYKLAETPYDKAAKKQELTEIVLDTASAIETCSHCPMLQKCRKSVIENIKHSTPPSGVVQAGIYWGRDAKPDFTLNGCITAASARQLHQKSQHPENMSAAMHVDDDGKEWPLTVPVYANTARSSPRSHKHGPVKIELDSWDLSWIPSLPSPISPQSIKMVIDSRNSILGIPQTKIRHHNSNNADGHEVLTDAEVCEALRQMFDMGWKLNRIARHININPRTARDLLIQLGAPIKKSESHSQTAIKREQKLREKRQREQALKQAAQIVPVSEAAWDKTEDGEQLDLCVAAFQSELFTA